VIGNLKEKLFYLSDEGLYFTNQPNLNRMIIAREENISDNSIYEEERRVMDTHISKSPKFRLYVHPKFSKDIPDTPELKLIILNKGKPDKEFLEKYSESPRVYRNTLIFLCVDESQKESFYLYLRKLLALKSIDEDKELKLTEGQRKEVKNKLKSYERREYEELRRLYRKLFLPVKDGYKEIDMGLPTFGESLLDKEIYEYLKTQGEVIEKIAPKVIRDKYMLDKDYIEIKKLYDAFLKTPGEIRLNSEKGFVESIKDGVKNGLFGFGYISGDEIECKYINGIPTVNLVDEEVIIKPELCIKGIKEEGEKEREIYQQKGIEEVSMIKEAKAGTKEFEKEKYSKISLILKVPVGQISTIAKIVNYLKNKFNQCTIEITIHASNGEIRITEYEDKVMEALTQGDIEIEEETKE